MKAKRQSLEEERYFFKGKKKKNNTFSSLLTCIPSLKHHVSTSASRPADSRITASGTVTTVTSQPKRRDSAAWSGRRPPLRRRWRRPRLLFLSRSSSFSSPAGRAGGSTHCFWEKKGGFRFRSDRACERESESKQASEEKKKLLEAGKKGKRKPDEKKREEKPKTFLTRLGRNSLVL